MEQRDEAFDPTGLRLEEGHGSEEGNRSWGYVTEVDDDGNVLVARKPAVQSRPVVLSDEDLAKLEAIRAAAAGSLTVAQLALYLNVLGRKVAAGSAPVVLSTEDKAVLDDIKTALLAQLDLAATIWTDDSGAFYVRRDVIDPSGTVTVSFTDPTGAPATPGAGLRPVSDDYETEQALFDATAGGTGYSSGDILARVLIIDTSAVPPTTTSIWTNLSTGATIGTPTNGTYVQQTQNIKVTSLPVGQQDSDHSTPVVLSDEQQEIIRGILDAHPGIELDPNNRTLVSPGASQTYTGTFTRRDRHGYGIVLVVSNQQLASALIRYSNDGITPVSGGLLSNPTNLTYVPPTAPSTFHLYFAFVLDLRIAPYYRVEATTTASDPTVFEVAAFWSPFPFQGSFTDLTAAFNPQNRYLLTRAVGGAVRRGTGAFDNISFPEHDRDIENEQVIPLTNGDAVVFTADDTLDTINAVGHGLVADQCVHFTSTGTLPAPLTATGHYFVVNPTADTFQVALTRKKSSTNGLSPTPVNLTDAGTGVHSYKVAAEFSGEYERLSDPDHAELLYASLSAMAVVEKVWSGDGINDLDREFSDGVTATDTSLVSLTAKFTRYDRGSIVTGAGIPADTRILTVHDATRVTLTRATTASASGVTVTLHSPFSPGAMAVAEQGGYNVYYDVNEGRNFAPYYKFHVINGPTDQTNFPGFIDIKWLMKNAYQGAFVLKDAQLNNLSRFLLGRFIAMGEQPDGDIVNQRATGLGRDRLGDDMEFPDDLAGNETIATDWMDTDQYENLDLVISSSVESAPNGLVIEYCDDVQAVTPRVIRTERATYGAEDAANGSLSRDVSARGDGFRISYTNGPVAASPFYLAVNIRVQARSPSNTLKGAISETSTAVMTRSALFAENDTPNDIQLIKRGPNDGLRVSVREHEADTPVGTLEELETGQGTANPTSVVFIPPPAFGDVKALSIANLSAETRLWFSKDTVTRLTGDVVFPGTKEHFETDGSKNIALITDPAAGATDQHDLDADTVDANNGVLNPTNLFAQDAAYATFNDQGDSVDISGFDATAVQTLDEVQSVILRMRGKKDAASPPTQTVAHVETQNGAQAGGVNVASAAMAGGTDLLYIVSVSRNALNSVSNISGGGLSFAPLIINKANGGRHLDVWYAFGSPSAGAVTASMTSSTNAHISVSSFSGVEPTSPIQDSDFATGTGTSVSTPSIDATNRGFAVLAVSHEAASATPGALYTERSDQTNGAGGNVDSLATQTKPLTVTGTETPTMTLASSTDWIAIGVVLLPRTVNPVITITNDQGSTVAVFTLTSTADSDFEKDITADLPDYADIDAMVLHIEATTMGDTDALIDRVKLDFTEAEEGASVRFAYKWLGVNAGG